MWQHTNNNKLRTAERTAQQDLLANDVSCTALVIRSLHFRRKASERLNSGFVPSTSSFRVILVLLSVISTGRVVQEGLLAHHHQGKQTIHFHQYIASESLAVDVLRMRRRREQSFLEEQQKGLVWVSGATECRPPVLENARAGKRCIVCTFSIHCSRSRPASPTHGIGLTTVTSVSGGGERGPESQAGSTCPPLLWIA